MISAPVGFQCPECSRGGQPNVKIIRPSDSFWNSLPVVTRSIIAACVGAFLIAMATGGQLNAAYSFGMSPLLVAQGEWWRLVTSTFLHINIMHILFNMYALLVLGSSLERTIGQARFILIYAFSAFGGSVASFWFSDLLTLGVGASGAVFGLMTATVVVGRALRTDVNQILFWLGLNIVFGFLSPGIDWRAHLGGALVGALVARIIVRSRTTKFTRAQISSMTILGLGLLGLVAIRVSTILSIAGS